MMSTHGRSYRPLRQLLRWGQVLFCVLGIMLSGLALLHPGPGHAAGGHAQLSSADDERLPAGHDMPGTDYPGCALGGAHCFPSAVLANADTSRGKARDAACDAEHRRLAGSYAAPLFHPPKLSA